MNPNDVAPMVAIVTLTVVTGGVLLLRPLVRRLGDLIQLMVEERRRELKPSQPAMDSERIVDVLESIENRLARLEEKQTFTDAILAGGSPQARPRIPDATPGTPAE